MSHRSKTSVHQERSRGTWNLPLGQGYAETTSVITVFMAPGNDLPRNRANRPTEGCLACAAPSVCREPRRPPPRPPRAPKTDAQIPSLALRRKLAPRHRGGPSPRNREVCMGTGRSLAFYDVIRGLSRCRRPAQASTVSGGRETACGIGRDGRTGAAMASHSKSFRSRMRVGRCERYWSRALPDTRGRKPHPKV